MLFLLSLCFIIRISRFGFVLPFVVVFDSLYECLCVYFMFGIEYLMYAGSVGNKRAGYKRVRNKSERAKDRRER